MVIEGTPLFSMSNDPARRAQTALAAYTWSVHIRQAERAIASRLAALPWWLEDAEGQRVTDESPEPLRAVRDLIEHPYAPRPGDPVNASPRTWEDLRNITIRHMGVVGYGFWYLVGIEALAGTPAEILYINPARLTPATNKAGQLIGWVMDANSTNPVPFETKEIRKFDLEPADEGHLPTGLVQTALAKAEISRLGDKHASYILASGGRMPGIYGPPSGGSIPEDQYQGLVRDIRSIVEMPDAAKRSLVLKGPLEFTETSQGPQDMQLLEVMSMSRDDILALWGVPSSQIGYERRSTIGSTADDLDYETMWHSAIWPRLSAFDATFQGEILDRYRGLGIVVSSTYELPEFDDKQPLYEMAKNTVSLPLSVEERREIMGLAPTGNDAFDKAVMWYSPGGRQFVVEMAGPTGLLNIGPEDALGDDISALEGMEGKARLLRAVASLQASVHAFLREQAERIGAKLERNSAHIARKPKDEAAWWNEREEHDALLKVLRPHIAEAAAVASERARQRISGDGGVRGVRVAGKAEPFDFRAVMEAAALSRLDKRIIGIGRTTRDRIFDLIAQGLEQGLSPAEVGRGLRGEVPPIDKVGEALARKLGDFGSELRAETIARTEMRVAQNAAQLDSFGTFGVTAFEMIDGDEDIPCQTRNGQTVGLAEAEMHMDAEHPNGTLDFAPVIGGKAEPLPPPVTATVAPSLPEFHVHIPELPAPIVNIQPPAITVEQPDINVEVPTIELPDINVEAPNVTVAAPDVRVEVEAQPAPIVNVEAPQVTVEARKADDIQPVFVTNMPGPKRFKVKRGPDNRISGVDQD